MVEFFVERGADDWSLGMGGAAQGGHRELVDYFIELGANNWYWCKYWAECGSNVSTGEQQRVCKDLVAFFQAKLQGH